MVEVKAEQFSAPGRSELSYLEEKSLCEFLQYNQSMTPGTMVRPCIAMELLPSIIPSNPAGNGPLIPVGIFTLGQSGVNIVEVVELRSNPALPGVALMSSVMGRRV